MKKEESIIELDNKDDMAFGDSNGGDDVQYMDEVERLQDSIVDSEKDE